MSDSLFHIIDHAVCILSIGGVYRQVKVFHRNEEVFARYGGGFVRIYKTGTSHPRLNWLHLEGEGIIIDKVKNPRYKNVA